MNVGNNQAGKIVTLNMLPGVTVLTQHCAAIILDKSTDAFDGVGLLFVLRCRSTVGGIGILVVIDEVRIGVSLKISIG